MWLTIHPKRRIVRSTLSSGVTYLETLDGHGNQTSLTPLTDDDRLIGVSSDGERYAKKCYNEKRSEFEFSIVQFDGLVLHKEITLYHHCVFGTDDRLLLQTGQTVSLFDLRTLQRTTLITGTIPSLETGSFGANGVYSWISKYGATIYRYGFATGELTTQHVFPQVNDGPNIEKSWPSLCEFALLGSTKELLVLDQNGCTEPAGMTHDVEIWCVEGERRCWTHAVEGELDRFEKMIPTPHGVLLIGEYENRRKCILLDVASGESVANFACGKKWGLIVGAFDEHVITYNLFCVDVRSGEAKQFCRVAS